MTLTEQVYAQAALLAGDLDDPGAVEAFRRTGALVSGRSRAGDSGGNPVSAAVVEHLAAGGDGSGGA